MTQHCCRSPLVTWSSPGGNLGDDPLRLAAAIVYLTRDDPARLRAAAAYLEDSLIPVPPA